MKRAVDDPRQLPELRAELLDLARPRGAWEGQERHRCMTEVAGWGSRSEASEAGIVITGPRGYTPDQMPAMIANAAARGNKAMEWYRKHLAESQLIYVAPELVDVVEAAAAAVPDDMAVTLADAPAPSGLVVLGRPLIGHDAGPERTGEPVRVDGMMWGAAQLPPPDIDWITTEVEYTIPSLAIASFRMIDSEADDTLGLFASDHGRAQLPLWMSLGRSDWPFGTPIPVRHRLDMPDQAHESMVEDRRWIAALWAVVNQERIVKATTWTPQSKAARRRHARMGTTPSVLVLHLRREQRRGLLDFDTSGRRVKVRFPVKPFFRQQPYGPGRSLRRWQLIPGHWRGPEGAPVVHVERVWSLDR